MVALTKVQNYNGSGNSYINFGALGGGFPSNSAHTWMVYFRQDSTDTGAFQYLLAKGNTSGEGVRLFTESIGGAGRYGMQSTSSALAPNRSSNSQLTQAQWHCLVAVYDGTGVALTDLRLFLSKNGAAFVEVTYDTGNQADGVGTIDADTADSFMLGNRPVSLNRWFKGKMAYAARFSTAFTSASECQAAFDNGPLSVASNTFCWANGADLKGGLTPTATGSGVTDDTVNLPPNTQLGEAAAPMAGTARSRARASGALTTAIPLAGTARLEAFARGALNAAISGAIAGTARAAARASGAMATAIPLSGIARIDARASGVLPNATTTLNANFAGANANTTLSSISNASTNTPTAVIRVRTPEDSEWQQWMYSLSGVHSKVITNELLLVEKEDDPDSYLGTWEGPWWSTNPAAGPSGWTKVAWSQVAGDRVTFTINAGPNDTIYVASLPPWTRDTVLALINELAAAYPTRIHDDLPSRIALGAGPYISGLSGSGVDENGRSVTNQPLYSFTVRDDSLGDGSPKRYIEVMCGVHSGEWNGGLQLRGFLRELLTGVHSTALLTRFIFIIRPLHSIKGNYLGFRRNEAASSLVNNTDANREWADGDGTLATVIQWQGILDVDHGVNHANRVVGFFDFHDGKNVSNKAWIYHFAGQTNVSAWAAIVAGQNANIGSELSGIASGTTSQYWMGKGVNFAWTCECADEKSTVAEIEALGEAYARSLKLADDAGLVPQLPGMSGSARVKARSSGALTTAIPLSGSAVAKIVASGALVAGVEPAEHVLAGTARVSFNSRGNITLLTPIGGTARVGGRVVVGGGGGGMSGPTAAEIAAAVWSHVLS